MKNYFHLKNFASYKKKYKKLFSFSLMLKDIANFLF